jgi:hypothetical protein
MFLFSHRQRSGGKGKERKGKYRQEIKVNGRPADPAPDLEQENFDEHKE